MQPSTTPRGPLHALKVIDLTQHLSGPFCSWTLSTLGADVIKVESAATGDGSRETPPFANGRSIYFESLNRGKKSLAIDLKSSEGQAILHRLLKDTDVLLENFRPGVRDRLGCSDETLKQVNPRLIVCSISGFGQTGRYSKDPSYDIIVQAMSGMMSVNGPVGSAGMRVGFSIGDIAAGLFATIGILARLYDRDTKKGAPQSPLDISMLSCQLALLENAYARFLNAGEIPQPIGSRHPSMVPFETYTATDGVLVVGLGTNADWPRFCNAIEAPHFLEDERFSTTELRLKHRDELELELNYQFGTKPRQYWLQRLQSANIAAGPQVTIPELANSDLAPEIHAFETIDANGKQFRFVRHPLSETTSPASTAAAELGANTIELLEGMGMSFPQIQELRSRGIVNFPNLDPQ